MRFSYIHIVCSVIFEKPGPTNFGMRVEALYGNSTLLLQIGFFHDTFFDQRMTGFKKKQNSISAIV